MKTALGFALVLSLSSSAFALDNPCVVKQKNAAAFAVAQEVGVPVQGAEIIAFNYGIWTEATANNVGSDQVTVRIGNRNLRNMIIKTYEVSAKQIGSSADCAITGVTEVPFEAQGEALPNS